MLSASMEQNRRIGAYSQILEETALLEAAASDRRRSSGNCKGPLDGIPIAIKDLIDTYPAVCKAGLEHLAQYRPQEDAAVVRALREAGAVIVGVTETDPGAFSTDTPQVINPLAPDRTVGGSSGGSGAVLAAGLAFAALGTDTGGSVRIPAACCSVYGFKPTWGRVDATGIRPLAPSLDHVGSLARCVTDLGIVQSILDPAIGPRGTDQDSGPLILGIAEEYFADAAYDVRSAMAQVLDQVGQDGWRLRKVFLPSPDEVVAFHMINLPKEAAAYHTEHFPDDWPSYPEIARHTVEMGNAISQGDYEKAEQRRRVASAAVDAALERVDAIILPTMPIDAPLRSAATLEVGGRMITKLEATIRYTSLFNQSGHPVVSMTAAILPGGRAVSIQLIGKKEQDGDLLMLAQRMERLLHVHVDYVSLLERQAQESRRIRAKG